MLVEDIFVDAICPSSLSIMGWIMFPQKIDWNCDP